ncbi:LITAF domain-containing protein-like [Daktulosphaira vitifoliae]|uniref:LITAF domain-containing protein-like n=1 Tax=Daktulosphaira vitifoliae TaxID=58002 RepID=UPI0021AA0193|nr:LITAF domain-containing protein-like [Daktulosphaira vitifoliae]
MNGQITPGIVPTAPIGGNLQASVPPASPFTPQPEFIKAPHELITTVVPLGPHSTRMVCYNCRQEITTNTTYKPSASAYKCSGLCCLFGCFWGPCLIPFCKDSFMNVEHRCPKCKTFLGQFVR